MSSPSSVMRDFGLTVARLVSSRMTVRAVTDLPEPDSPTRAIVSPLCSWNETSSHRLDDAALDLEVDGDVAGIEDQLATMRSEVVPFGRSEVEAVAMLALNRDRWRRAGRRPAH